MDLKIHRNRFFSLLLAADGSADVYREWEILFSSFCMCLNTQLYVCIEPCAAHFKASLSIRTGWKSQVCIMTKHWMKWRSIAWRRPAVGPLCSEFLSKMCRYVAWQFQHPDRCSTGHCFSRSSICLCGVNVAFSSVTFWHFFFSGEKEIIVTVHLAFLTRVKFSSSIEV